MKKKVVVLIIATLLIGGCSYSEPVSVDNSLPSNNESLVNEGNSQGDVEEDVNASDLSEDQDLTEIAEEEHKTEEDTLLPQDEVEEETQNKIEDEEIEEGKIEDEVIEEGEIKDINDEEEQDQKVQQEQQEEYPVLNVFNTQLPESINLDLKYDRYPISYDYFLVLGANINVREKPTTASKIVEKALLYEKLNLVERVKGQYLNKYNSDIWYKVFWKNKNGIEYGYVFGGLGEPRSFQFEKMKESINNLKKEVDTNSTAYISNYKNRNGMAPLYNGAVVDKYGIKRYQAAPAYLQSKTNSEFRYISDGTLVTILGSNDKFYKIRTLNFQGEYWVPKKYLSFSNSIKNLTNVVVVDRKNQNEGVFEYKDGKWNLISYIFSTTGENSKYKEETSLGYYMAIQRRERFLYLDDKTREISGYAPYAIRFNGGAYIHGVPVQFQIVKEEKIVGEETIVEEKKIDPGIKEYLYTIGTVPRSHKCVRNYTSHAQFLYNWVKIGNSAVIVIE